MDDMMMDEIFHEDNEEPNGANVPNPAPLVQDPIVLQPFQQDAVDVALSRYTLENGKKSQMLYGGTGSGKTVVSQEILSATVRADPPNPTRILIVVPAVGGNLPRQWQSEIKRQGVPVSDVLLFSGHKIREQMERWEAMVAESPENLARPLYVIATFHGLHADIDRVHGEQSRLLTTKWDHVVIDECQFWRNLTHRLKECDVDPDKKMARSMMRVMNSSKPRVLVVSATPYYNNKCDIYSQVVLMGLANGNKHAWQRKATVEEWKAQKRWFYKNHIVTIVVPPAVSRVDNVVRHDAVMTNMGEGEIERAYDSYCALEPLIQNVLRILEQCEHLAGGALNLKLQELDAAMKVMLGELTRARRGLLHPAFYDLPIKEMRNGKEITLPVPMSRYNDFPKEDCSKFNQVIDELDKYNGRVLITAHFSRPLDFLQHHLEKYAPDWHVVVHHGKTNCIKALQSFQQVGQHQNTVMLATAPSVGEGVNLSMTTNNGKDAIRMINLDFPLSDSAQKQLEGRIKRPLAQPDVEQWNVHRIMTKASVLVSEGALQGQIVEHDTVDHALLKTLMAKEFDADEMFMSDEELANVDGGPRASAYGEGARDNMKKLLTSLLNVCEQWGRTEKAEHKRLREEEKARKKEERKRRIEEKEAEKEAKKRAKKGESDSESEEDGEDGPSREGA